MDHPPLRWLLYHRETINTNGCRREGRCTIATLDATLSLSATALAMSRSKTSASLLAAAHSRDLVKLNPVGLTDDLRRVLVAYDDLTDCVDENHTDAKSTCWPDQILCVLDCRMTHLQQTGLCKIWREHGDQVRQSTRPLPSGIGGAALCDASHRLHRRA